MIYGICAIAFNVVMSYNCIVYALISREASDAGEFHLKTKSRDFRVIFNEK